MTAVRKLIEHRCALLIAALLVASSILVSSAEAAGVYMWLDAKGITHYDDQNNYPSRRVTQDRLDRRLVVAMPFSTPPAGFADRVKQLCKINRERLGNYRQARALYGQDPAGNVYRMSPTQVGITIAETERDDVELCAPGAADRLYAQRIAALTEPTLNPATHPVRR